MSITISRLETKSEDTRTRIKSAARALFSAHGIEQVSIRDIARAAGQKNGGSINYHFRSKDDLVREIINDIAAEMNHTLDGLLDELEAAPAAPSLRDILELLITPRSARAAKTTHLLVSLQMGQVDLLSNVIASRFHTAFERCVAHLKRLLPHMPSAILRQRLFFLVPSAWMFIAAREMTGGPPAYWMKLLSSPVALLNLLDAAEGMLAQPASAGTLTAFEDFNRAT
jgi:AcrR family transcriptional regulator